MNERMNAPTIVDRFDPRHNSVNALRLLLAGAVLVSHGIKFGGGEDPLGAVTGGRVDLGTVAVDGFFVLSGFLIVRSYLSSPSTWRYLWRRCLRILPGFWICLLVSAVVILPLAQLLEYGTLSGFPLTGDLSVVTYVTHNWFLFMQQFDVRGLMAGEAVDGSLYTLFYEFACYLGVAALGLLGLYLRRRWTVVAIVTLVWLVTLANLVTDGGVTRGSTTMELFLRLGGMFLAGMVFQLWSARIPFTRLGAVLALMLLAASVFGASRFGVDPGSWLIYQLLAPPAIAYLLLYAGSSTKLAAVGAKRDISYGLYIYAWPIQVLLLLVGAAAWHVSVYLAVSIALACGAAYLSWILVESPALSLKSWTPRWIAADRRARHGRRPLPAPAESRNA